MAAIRAEQTRVKPMHQLLGGPGQTATTTQQLLPEPFARGLKRHRPKSVAHLLQKLGQMALITPPIRSQTGVPMGHRPLLKLLLEPGLDGVGVYRPIRLSKARQATDAHATTPAQEPSHPNQKRARQPTYIPPVVGQRLQTVCARTVRAVFRRLDLLVMLLLDILHGGQ